MSQRLVLILANGVWEDTHRLRDLAKDASFTIAADGAWAKACAQGIGVDLVVGDLDSLTAAERARLDSSATPVEAHPTDKDDTDLELAVVRALEENPSLIRIYGAFGGRIDHMLASVFLLELGLTARVPIELLRGNETLCLVEDSLTLANARLGERVSILPITETARVSTVGLRYPLRKEKLLRAASRGVSNETTVVPPRIQVHEGRVFVLHATADDEVAP